MIQHGAVNLSELTIGIDSEGILIVIKIIVTILDFLALAIDIIQTGLGNQGVQVALGHLVSVGSQRSVGISAHLVQVVHPLSTGTAIGVGGVLSTAQVAVVQLLTQLHDVTLGGNAGGGSTPQGVNGAGIGLLAGDILIFHAVGDSDVAHSDVLARLVGLDHARLQSVQNQLGHVVAGHSLPHAGVHIVEQADLVALGDGGQLPVAVEVAVILEVAQSLHQHQSGLSSGHSLVAAVGGGAGAGGDAVGPAGSHIGLGPGGHVGEGAGASVGGHAVVHQVGHHNRHLITGDQLVRIEVSVLIAHHDADFFQNGNGFHVILGGNIRIGSSAGAHDHQTGDHGGSHAQAENPLQVSHWNSSLHIFAFFQKTENEDSPNIFDENSEESSTKLAKTRKVPTSARCMGKFRFTGGMITEISKDGLIGRRLR